MGCSFYTLATTPGVATLSIYALEHTSKIQKTWLREAEITTNGPQHLFLSPYRTRHERALSIRAQSGRFVAMTFREIHGLADGKKVMMIGETDDTEVRVIDGKGRVILIVPAHPTSLTTEQARHVAACLINSAARLDAIRPAKEDSKP